MIKDTFLKTFMPQDIEPQTKTVEDIRVDWAVGLIAMNDIEQETGLSGHQANEERHKLIVRYIKDLHSAKDFAQHNRSTVALYWKTTIQRAKSVAKELAALNSGIDDAYISDTVDHLKFQRDIELDLLRFT